LKLATRLQSQMNFVFVVTAALGFLVLSLNTYFSVTQIKDKAINLITSHLKEIATAGITAQSMADIDREAARLTEAWRATQDIDMRSDIYVDGQLIAHSGQLQKFGLLSSFANEKFALPSNQNLEIHIELDLAGVIFSSILLSTTFFIFLSGCYLLIRSKLFKTIREITSPIENRATWLSNSYGQSPGPDEYHAQFESSNIEEVKNLDASLLSFISQIKILEESAAKQSFDLGRLKMAEHLAHNIKGPLASLQMRISVLDISEEQKFRLIEGVNNVLMSSQALLTARKVRAVETAHDVDIHLILSRTITDFKERLPERVQLAFLHNDVSQIPIKGISTEIESMFRNILDNAGESISAKGKIEVSVQLTKNQAAISIKDTGCGIPKDRLPLLMKEGATFGKPNGTGLGLSHALSTIQTLGGKIEIDSEIGSGTTVKLEFPVTAKASELPSIEIDKTQTVVILDDDPLIHQCWQLKIPEDSGVKRVNLYSAQEFELWMAQHGPGDFGSRVYFMDYDLKTDHTNGIDLIARYDLALEARLITGMADSDPVISEARRNRIRLISKSNLANMQISILNRSDDAQISGHRGSNEGSTYANRN